MTARQLEEIQEQAREEGFEQGLQEGRETGTQQEFVARGTDAGDMLWRSWKTF